MLGDWASLLIYLLFAALVAGSLLYASVALGTRGAARAGRSRTRSSRASRRGSFQPTNFSVNYYLAAMLFIVFDIEIVYLYPLAVILEPLGSFGFVELCAFVAVLAIGYVYIWRKGALEWK